MDPTPRLTALLAPLTNYERRRPDRPRWSLDTMRALLAASDYRPPSGRLVQVGGSKGKGTTTLYLESLAEAAGLRTGSYLSPHLQTLLERVRIDGADVSEDELLSALQPALRYAHAIGAEVTFFEAMTRAALHCFQEHDVDLGVLEVGLGGRLDSTTAVPVDGSIVTSVELEHTELLGDTEEAIAAEKAWVLRPARPGFTAASGPALSVLRRHAAAVGNDLHVLGEDFGLIDVRDRGDGFEGALRTADGRVHPFVLPAASRIELPALALAAAAFEHLYPGRLPSLTPVPRPDLPGRCEILSLPDGGPLVLDGAHTERSLQALAAELQRRWPGEPVSVLCASATRKRWREGLKWLLPRADSYLVTALSGTASEAPETIVSWLRGQGADAAAVGDVCGGVRQLLERPGVRVVTGSFYLVGEARSCLQSLRAPTPA